MDLQEMSRERYGKDYDELTIVQRFKIIDKFIEVTEKVEKAADIYCTLPKKPK